MFAAVGKTTEAKEDLSRLDDAAREKFARRFLLDEEVTSRESKREAGTASPGRYENLLSIMSPALPPPSILRKAATAFYNVGNYARAIEMHTAILNVTTDRKIKEDSHHWRGHAFQASGDAVRAVGDFEEAAAIAPDEAPYWRDMAEAAWQAQELEKALVASDKRLALETSIKGFVLRGRVRAALGDRAGAHDDFARSIQIPAKTPDDRVMVAYAFAVDGQIGKGLELLGDAVESSTANYHRAALYAINAARLPKGQREGELRLAVAELKKAKANEAPEWPDVQTNPDFAILRENPEFKALLRKR